MTMFCCHGQHYASSASIRLHKAPICLTNFLPGYLWEGIHWAVLRIPRDFHMYMDYSALLFSPLLLYMVLQANSLNYSIYGSSTVSQLYLVFSNGVMIFVYMTRLQLARCQ